MDGNLSHVLKTHRRVAEKLDAPFEVMTAFTASIWLPCNCWITGVMRSCTWPYLPLSGLIAFLKYVADSR